jgi:amino acid adenylation domain-containing protein
MVKLLETLNKLGIYLQVQGDELKIKGSKENLTPEIISEIKAYKAELVRFLRSNAVQGQAAGIIPAIEERQDAMYPLSSPQRRLWVMSQVEGSGIAYNIPGTYIFEGSLDVDALDRAFETLIQRHESLRTVFIEDAQGEVRQHVLSSIPFHINYHDLQQETAPGESVKTIVQSGIACRFQLAAGPLLRATLIRLQETKWVFAYVMHHIISDGWSMGVLIKELLLLYNAYSTGRDYTLPPLRIQYKDFTAWQQQQLSGEQLQQHKAWWLQQFEGELPVLELPADNTRPAIKTFNGHIINRKLDAQVTQPLKAFCRQHDATLFMGLLAAVNALLHRYTGQGDIVIGSPIAGRDHADLEGQIGFYVNTLALRTRFNDNESFADLLAATRQVTLKAYEHQAYPFDELVNGLGLQRDMSRHPLFDVMVALQNAGDVAGGNEVARGLSVREYKETESLGSKFDWLFIFTEVGDELQVTIEYNTDIYNENTVAQAWMHFEQLLQAMTAQPAASIKQLEYLSAGEKQQLLFDFNDTSVEYPRDKTIAALFEEQAQQTPEKIALVFKGIELSYRQLNERANGCAHYLLANYQIKPDDLIAIKLERSEWLIITILAVLKSGAAYVPVDPAYPQDRIDYMVTDCNCKIMIDEALLATIKTLLSVFNNDNPEAAATASDLAYVMYTSGSTGRPKGAMIEQRSVVRLVKSAAYAGFTGNEILLSTGAVSFDATTFEYWGMLLNGGKLVLCSTHTLLDAQQMAGVIRKEQVDIMFFTTGWFNQLVDKDIAAFNGLKTVLTGGEKLSTFHVQALLDHYPGIKIIHCYGPTENTAFSLTYNITPPIQTPIGKPISNSTAYIIDINGQLSPIGVTGEICVGGDGLARGYLNQPELTAQKFVPNPFVPGGRLYKTGDLGRRLPDGNILFAGRKDDQVKIRGYRIEPGEIETVIKNHPAVESAVVITRLSASAEKELAAYFVTKGNAGIQEIRSFVAKELPDYMVPAHFVQLPSLPLNSNGKVDRRNLPDPADVEDSTEHVAPRNETEEKLVAIWQEVLGKERISITDDFFECGGHSLKLTRLRSQLQKIFDVTIAYKELFSSPVLQHQAGLIRKARKAAWLTIEPLPRQEHYPLSAAQRRLWILSQFRQSSLAYNIPSVYVFEGRLDIAAIEHAFRELIARHESLRTVFRQDESGEVRQYILPAIDIHSITSFRDLAQENDPEQLAKTLVQQEINTPFDLAHGPLLRATLYQLPGGKWIFIYIMHHIISDAWSMNILMNELLLFYNACTTKRPHGLKPLRIHYKDYAAWQQSNLLAEGPGAHRNYWLQQFAGPLPVLTLPFSRHRPAAKTYAGGTVQKRLPENVSTAIKSLCLDEDSTLFMGLLAAVNALLHSYTRQEDIIIGTPIAGREHADLDDQIGFYINTLALRTRFSGQGSFAELLSCTREVTLGAYGHQAYPFDELVEQLRLQRDAARNALFDVMVVLQNTGSSTAPQTPPGLKVNAYTEAENPVSAFDLTFNFIEIDNEIIVSIEYNSDLFTRSSILRMTDDLHQLLETVTQDPRTPLNALLSAAAVNQPRQQKRKQLIDDLEL